ncbi:MAG: hypothetical protein QOG55_1077 [Acidobacteriaceae bacterium]|nr:hypothetical protein [Acidobacteriaceae bacterium]
MADERANPLEKSVCRVPTAAGSFHCFQHGSISVFPRYKTHPPKNLRVGHPSRYFNFLWTLLKGFEDFDFAFFAEDVHGDACGIAVDDYVAVGAGDT